MIDFRGIDLKIDDKVAIIAGFKTSKNLEEGVIQGFSKQGAYEVAEVYVEKPQHLYSNLYRVSSSKIVKL